ncbi:6-phosphogluconolactonase [Thermodesulfobacteriota bacterium]
MRSDKPQIVIMENPADLARAGARILTSTSKERITKTGRFVMAISGGSSPGPMHKLLTKEPYLSEIQWSKTHIFWVDDRCVPENNPFSNYGTARREFLDLVPIPSGQAHNMPTELSPEEGARSYQKELIRFFQLKEDECPTFDLIFLGIGPDGHTASLFPGHRALKERKKLVISVKGGNPYLNRLTMTCSVLNNAGKIVFIAFGKGKAEILKSVFKQGEKSLPAQIVHPISGELIWLLDREAASSL